MTVNRTTLLDLPLPVTGTESGTWGDTTNNGLTQYVDIAIAGMSNLTSANFTAGALTIETTEGDSSATNISATSAQYAGFRVTSLAANSTITVGNTGTSPARSYRLINADATYSLTFKATGQTGVTLLPGQSALVAFNGTDYVIVGTVGAGSTTDNTVPRFDGTTGKILQSSGITIDDSNNVSGVAQLNITTLDATNIEVTNIKAKDGTAAASIADSTGVISVTSNPVLSGGTANGVLYLNGSKVATSGSALTFDGTTLGAPQVLLPNGNSYQIKSAAGVASAVLGMDASNNLYLGASGAVATNIFYTGGSEQMRLTSTGLGIGTSSVTNPLTIVSATATTKLSSSTTTNQAYHAVTNASGNMYFGVNNSANSFFAAAAYAGIVWHDGAYPIVFGTSNTERMRLDSSGNLGIGTSSPSTKLQVNGNVYLGGAARNIYADNGSGIFFNGLNNFGSGIYSDGSGTALKFQTSSTDRMTLDSSGNLGLGVTPSAWNSSIRALQGVGGWGAFYTDSGYYGTTGIVKNAFWTSTSGTSWNYVNTQPALRYELGGSAGTGTHAWYIAGSGTANTGVSWTQAMTLDASGNLSVGTTTTPTQITFAGSSGITYQRSTDNTFSGVLDYLKSRGSAASPTAVQNGDDLFLLRVAPYHGSAYTYLTNTVVQVDGTFTSGQNPPTRIAWYTNAANGGSTERARITSAGDFRVTWTNNIFAGFYFDSTYYQGLTNGATNRELYIDCRSDDTRADIVFRTGLNTAVTERARITSGGVFVIGNGGNNALEIVPGAVSGTPSRRGIKLPDDPDGYFDFYVNSNQNNPTFRWKNGSGGANAMTLNGISGDLAVVGALSKGSGSFKIDHPLKPITHHLVHSFIEGPQADLIYRGKIELVEGHAKINIDSVSGMTEGTFVALCREVQCFTSNESDWDAVKGSVNGNILTIQSQNINSSAIVSWMVIGERQDQHMYDTEWTDENGKVIVEPEKTTT